jgi:imidazolonepropionase-like amidohydrolase
MTMEMNLTNAHHTEWTQRRNGKKILLLLGMISFLFFWQQSFASDPIPAAKQKRPVALIGGTIHTISGATIENGTIVFDQGRITAVGKEAVVPGDAERITVSGKQIYPGIIDAATSMGLVEIGAVRATVDVAETGSINPNVRAEVAVNPESEMIPVARSGGITVTATMPRGGLLSGMAAAMMTDGWTNEEMILRAPLGLVVNWPQMTYIENPYRRQTKEEWQKSRDAQLKALDEAFDEARAYRTAKEAEKGKGLPYHQTDSRWDAMIPVLEKKTPVFINANEVQEIQTAINWGERVDVRLVIVGGHDAWMVTDQLKQKNIPVIVADIFSGAERRGEAYDLVYSLPKKLKDAGVRFCITGDRSGSNSRRVRHHAAAAAAFGLSKDEALKAITLDAAEILGIGDRVGSLETGKDATLIITNGDPLELPTTIEQVYIQGRKCDMRDKHKQLYEKYQVKYRQNNK